MERSSMRVVDCGQTLVSYTKRLPKVYDLSRCGLRTDLGELHLSQAKSERDVWLWIADRPW